ncbi:MAG: Capsular exopolysaccharide family [Chthoniobacteraceae bacterium]|nr:Capsular exopolysaccharide family [Chthoniobacteraceae bacterium]
MQDSDHEVKSPSSSWPKFLNALYRYQRLIKSRWWILLLSMSLGLGVAAWWVSIQPQRFSSVGRIVVSGKMNMPEGAVYSEELNNFYGTQIELMQSGEVQRRAQERVEKLRPDLAAGVASERVKLDVAQMRGAAIFVLKATGDQSEYTRLFLESTMEEYMNSRREMRADKSEGTLTAITAELVRIEKELRAGEAELLDFQRINNVGFLQEAGNSAAAYAVTLNRQLADLRTEYDLLKLLDLDQNLERIQKRSADTSQDNTPGSESVLKSFGPESEYLKARQQLELLKAKKQDLSKELRPAHPTMIDIDQDISRYETLIKTFRTQSLDQLKTRQDSIAIQIQNLEKSIKEWETKALDLSQRMAEYSQIKAKVDRAKAIYERLTANLRNVDVTNRINLDTITILDKASPPVSVRPELISTIIKGLVMGLLLGMGILYFLDKIDDRMTCFGEFYQYFDERVIGQVAQQGLKGDLSHLVNNDERHAFAESFRALRSSILYLPGDERQAKVFLITSSIPSEGKSTIATNLAITFAFGNSRVLLIDTDVRRGRLHTAFSQKMQPGLAEILKGEARVEECVRPTKIENLFLLPRGELLNHPGEHFLSQKFDELIAAARNSYDYIFVDSSPVMVADDTFSLAPKMDACIYVVRFSYSSAAVSRKGLDLLHNRQVKVIGVVCNDVHAAMPEYYHQYQYPDYYAVDSKI